MKRFDLRLRLGATFGLLGAVLFVVGWQGVRHLRQLDRQMQKVIFDGWSREQLVREAFRLSNLNSRLTLSIFLLDDPAEIQRLLAQRTANTDRISELIRAIEPQLETNEEKRLLAAVETARKPYIESYLQALAKLVDEHQREEARKIMAGVTLPRIAVYHAAWNAFTQCQTDKIEQGIKQSKADFAAAQRNLLALIILAVLITVAIAVYVTVRVTREVTERERAEEAVRQFYDQLEQRIQQRTTELAHTNQALQTEIAERKRSEESLRLQSAALEAAANAIVITDQAGNILWVNAAFTAFTGYTAPEVAGRNPRLLKSGNHDAAFYRNLWQTISAGQVWSGEMSNRRKDGSVYAEEMTITPLRNADGVITRYIAIKQDITKRKQAEEALRLTEERNRSIIESAQDAFINIDASGRIGNWNRQAESIFGWPRADAMGRFLHETIIPEKHHKAHLQGIRRLQANGEGPVLNKCIEITALRRNGDEFPVELTIWALQMGAETTYNAFLRDITERQRAQAELENVHRQLLEASRQSGMAEIAVNVLHNVGNALNSVNVSSNLIAINAKKFQRLKPGPGRGPAARTRDGSGNVYYQRRPGQKCAGFFGPALRTAHGRTAGHCQRSGFVAAKPRAHQGNCGHAAELCEGRRGEGMDQRSQPGGRQPAPERGHLETRRRGGRPRI